mmetsp:Transcript_25963/g.82704  ORF Transcript_25963/g.82704 Transcript_25963/m.82704 type:complete len:215 (-) Transcript_25963:1442-2086(-)
MIIGIGLRFEIEEDSLVPCHAGREGGAGAEGGDGGLCVTIASGQGGRSARIGGSSRRRGGCFLSPRWRGDEVLRRCGGRGACFGVCSGPGGGGHGGGSLDCRCGGGLRGRRICGAGVTHGQSREACRCAKAKIDTCCELRPAWFLLGTVALDALTEAPLFRGRGRILAARGKLAEILVHDDRLAGQLHARVVHRAVLGRRPHRREKDDDHRGRE